MGSLSNVVGYQSVKSTTVNDSPLFQTRTQRANNQEQNIIASQYIRKGNANHLCIPMRDNRTELLKRAIEYISKMDDKTFERFTELFIQKVGQDKSLKRINSENILKLFKILRTKSVSIINSFSNENTNDLTSDGLVTICIWFPGCILYIIMIMPVVIYLTLLLIYMENHPTFGPSCDCQP